MSIKWHQFMYRAKHFKLPHNEKDTVNWRDVDRETHNFPSLKYYSNIASYCSTRVFTCTRVYYITCYITYTLYHTHGISHRWYRSSADSTWNEIVTSMIIRINGRNDFLQFIRLLNTHGYFIKKIFLFNSYVARYIMTLSNRPLHIVHASRHLLLD